MIVMLLPPTTVKYWRVQLEDPYSDSSDILILLDNGDSYKVSLELFEHLLKRMDFSCSDVILNHLWNAKAVRLDLENKVSHSVCYLTGL